MPLTSKQLHEIRQIIRDHHYAFIINNVGIESIAPEIVEDLKKKGMVDINVKSIEDAYIYGQLISTTDNPRVAKMSYDEFKSYIKKNPVPLNNEEKTAMQFAQQQAGQYAVGLGNRVEATTGQILVEADAELRAKTRGIIRDVTAENIARRETVKKAKSNLGWATKDWARDWDRIAVTEKQIAMQRGVADSIADKYGSDVLVAKVPASDACKHCKKAYLADDAPRIFKLSTLEANGLTNVGRKAADYKPVLGVMHPNCICNLVRIPKGWGFDEDGSLVPGGELGVKYKDSEDFKKDLPVLKEPKFVVLEKASSGKLSTFVGASSSRAGAQNPGPGTVSNQIVGTKWQPAPTVKDMKPNPREFVEDQAHFRDRGNGQRLDPEDLVVQDPYPVSSMVERYVIPATQPYRVEAPKDVVDDNREMLEEELLRKQAINRNLAEVTDEDSQKARTKH